MSGADNNETAENENQQDDYEKENYVSIQDYTGEGYTLYDANEEYGKIAEENRDTVVAAVQQYFLDNYSIEVEVHNIVSAMDGVTVFVESIGEPHFYTIAIVPIDLQNEEIKSDSLWTREGEVETAIKSGLYAMAFEEEFSTLDNYLEGFAEQHPVIGRSIEAIENVGGRGFTTPYYHIAATGEVFEELYNKFESNPDITKQELKKFFSENPFEPKYMIFGIEFYMEENDAQPDEDIFNKLVSGIEEMEGIPKGAYSIYLNDNYINKTRASGKKGNTLERKTPNKIVMD